jgi:hypothetical protein
MSGCGHPAKTRGGIIITSLFLKKNLAIHSQNAIFKNGKKGLKSSCAF